ncbi:MAG: hypothetical protein WCL22_04605, partial [bacterium]
WTTATGSGAPVRGTAPTFITSVDCSADTFNAFAFATTLLTIGGTGANASMFAPSTLDATSSITGAIRTSGGISAAKNINAGVRFIAPAGSSSAVSFGWDANTGLYKTGGGSLVYVVAGSQLFLVSNGGVSSFTNTLATGSGTVSSPSYSFNAESTAGLNRPSAGILQLCVASAAQMTFTSTGGTIAGTLAVTGATTLTGNLTSNGALISTPQALSGAGAVNVTTLTTAVTTTAPAQALTLADGTNGQIKTIMHQALSGGGTWVLTPTTKTGYTTITSIAVGETCTLQFFTTIGWCILSLRGAIAA